MFPRVLLNNKNWHMTIEWFGLGKLVVSHYPTGRNALAPNWLKTHFVNTIHALSAKGTEIDPDNSTLIEVIETYAEFILDPNSLRARAAFLQTPQQLADAILLVNSSVKIKSSDCSCLTPPFNYLDYVSEPIGIDMTNQRHGQVSLNTCKNCGTKWLNYLVEYEAFTASGRWFRGPITDAELSTLSAQNAVPFLEQLPWHFVGGSYYRSSGMRRTGKIHADL